MVYFKFKNCQNCGKKLEKRNRKHCSRTCQYEAYRGTKHTEETKLKISKITKEKLSDPKTIEKMRLAKLGKKQPKDVIEKRNKTMNDLRNTKEYHEAISNGLKGHYVSSETREKIADSRRGNKHWTTRLPYTEEHKSKLREARLHQTFPTKDSKPERMFQLALTLYRIKFEKHKALTGQPDIFVKPNICIFIDGDYWHAHPEKYNPDDVIIAGRKASEIWQKDLKITNDLNKQGYIVLRIWESDILDDADRWAKSVLDLIKSATNNILNNSGGTKLQ